MSWIKKFFGKEKKEPNRIATAAKILISNDLDPKESLPALTKLGFDSPEVLRMVGLIPIVCGRILLASANPVPKFPAHYVVTNNGRSNIEVSFNECPIYNELYQYIISLADQVVAVIGPTSCEMQSLNWALNKLEEAGQDADITKVQLQAPELLF